MYAELYKCWREEKISKLTRMLFPAGLTSKQTCEAHAQIFSLLWSTTQSDTNHTQAWLWGCPSSARRIFKMRCRCKSSQKIICRRWRLKRALMNWCKQFMAPFSQACWYFVRWQVHEHKSIYGELKAADSDDSFEFMLTVVHLLHHSQSLTYFNYHEGSTLLLQIRYTTNKRTRGHWKPAYA